MTMTTNYQISINGIRVEDAEVSKWVLEKYLKLIDHPIISISNMKLVFP